MQEMIKKKNPQEFLRIFYQSKAKPKYFGQIASFARG